MNRQEFEEMAAKKREFMDLARNSLHAKEEAMDLILKNAVLIPPINILAPLTLEEAVNNVFSNYAALCGGKEWVASARHGLYGGEVSHVNFFYLWLMAEVKEALRLTAERGDSKVTHAFFGRCCYDNSNYPIGDIEMFEFLEDERALLPFHAEQPALYTPPGFCDQFSFVKDNLFTDPTGWMRLLFVHPVLAFPKPITDLAMRSVALGRETVENADFLFGGMGLFMAYELRKAVLQHRRGMPHPDFPTDHVESLCREIKALVVDDFDSPTKSSIQIYEKLQDYDDTTLRFMTQAALTRMNANPKKASELEDKFVTAIRNPNTRPTINKILGRS